MQLTAPTTPDPVAIPDARLDAVQCVSSGNCVVAGADYGAESAYLFTATLSAGTWTAPTLLSEPTNSKVANSVSVACASVYRCMIVASHGPGIIGWTTSAWTEASGTWGGPVQIAAKDQFLASGMACPSTQTCLVVGSTETPQHPAYMVKSGGVWSSPRQLPLPRLSPLASAGWLNEISCASASLCVAEGNLITTGAALGGVVSWSNGKWSSIGLFRGSTGSTEEWATTGAPAAELYRVNRGRIPPWAWRRPCRGASSMALRPTFLRNHPQGRTGLTFLGSCRRCDG